MAQVMPYRLSDCPKCGGNHEYSLNIDLVEQVMTFSGPPVGSGRERDASGGSSVPARTWDVEFRCPAKRRPFTRNVVLPATTSGRILSVTSGPQTASPAVASDWRDTELAEWIKASVGTARDFCRSMITSTLAAIPIYFTVLKFLGFESLRGSGWRILAIVPPFLFLAALVAFVMTLRPVLRRIDRDELPFVRERQLTTMNKSIRVGLALFGVAIVNSVVILLILVWK